MVKRAMCVTTFTIFLAPRTYRCRLACVITAALYYLVGIRQADSLLSQLASNDDPTIIRHLHDLAALEAIIRRAADRNYPKSK